MSLGLIVFSASIEFTTKSLMDRQKVPPNRHLIDFLGLHERNGLEYLIQRSEASGEQHKCGGKLHHHHFTNEEVVELQDMLSAMDEVYAAEAL